MNQTQPHFLLVGHAGSHNRGCEALVRTTVSILREQYPHSDVTVASMYPENDMPLLDIEELQIIPGICRVPSLYHASKPESPKEGTYTSLARRLLTASLPYGLVKRFKSDPQIAPRPTSAAQLTQVNHLEKAMLAADVIISIGGDLFIEDYGPPIYALELLEYAQMLKCKTMVWSASIWPFKNSVIERRAKEVFDHCDVVTVRDRPTLGYMESLHVTSKVHLVADGAFLMPPKQTSRTELGWTSRPNLVLGFNGTSLFLSSKRIRALIDFLQVLIDEWGCGIILIPHDAAPGSKERDVLYEIQHVINRPEQVILPPLGLTAQETKAVIGQCDIFLGMRFHPSIAALSQSVPTLGMSHSPKFEGLHREVYGHAEYLIPYEMIACDTLLAKFQLIMEHRDEVVLQLRKKVPELQASARQNGMLVREMLQNQFS